jgi:hypothetical protein
LAFASAAAPTLKPSAPNALTPVVTPVEASKPYVRAAPE